jgi:hypothetical protein
MMPCMSLRPARVRAVTVLVLSTLLLAAGLVLSPLFPPATRSRSLDVGILVAVYLAVTLSCVVDLRKGQNGLGGRSN